ncbi:hypothetical protein [Bradyrhizobium elkanii]|uniref:hypothetical protein n=1 Tax=Bradyrhizobium elkanii TaxID=29448 RepID=UPI0004160766|nr:hypothetical protein [Bradyrhizobium elkanii]
MPILQWRCAHGEAPAVTLPCAATVAIAPHDDSVDSNVVLITGKGTIESFGDGPHIIKRVLFEPGITLKHSAQLQLLSCTDREISTAAVGWYACDGAGHWHEVHFSATGAAELTRRLEVILRRFDEIEARLERLEQRSDVDH